jgi:hypothetical protein
MRCAGNLKYAGRSEMHTEFLVEKIEGERDSLEDLGVDGSVVLKWVMEGNKI